MDYTIDFNPDLKVGEQLDERNLTDRTRERAQFLGTKLAGMCAFLLEGTLYAAAQREVIVVITGQPCPGAVGHGRGHTQHRGKPDGPA